MVFRVKRIPEHWNAQTRTKLKSAPVATVLMAIAATPNALGAARLVIRLAPKVAVPTTPREPTRKKSAQSNHRTAAEQRAVVAAKQDANFTELKRRATMARAVPLTILATAQALAPDKFPMIASWAQATNAAWLPAPMQTDVLHFRAPASMSVARPN